MKRFRTLIAAAALGFAAPGCIHIHLDGEDKEKVVPLLGSSASSSSRAAPPKADSGVKPASAMLPSAVAALPKALTKPGSAKNQAVEISAAWQNRVAYLPDPTRDGAMGAGLVGQLFLFGSNMQIAVPEGPLTVELYDETPKSNRPPESTKLGRWTIDKDTLRKFRIHDERWGPCYALFLPWPDYRADIVRIRLTVKYEPEGGFPIFATPSTITIDTSMPGSNSAQPVVNTVIPGHTGGFGPQNVLPPSSTMSPIGGPPPAMGAMPQGPMNAVSQGPTMTAPMPMGAMPQGPMNAMPPAAPKGPTTYVIPATNPQPQAPVGPQAPMAPQPPVSRSPMSANVVPPPMPIPTHPTNGAPITNPAAGLPPIAFTTGPQR